MYSVYALGDPRDGQIRYVGITQDIHKRYAQHLLSPKNTGKMEWFNEMKASGMVPTLTVLESNVDVSIIYEREKYWIKRYLVSDAQLTNIIIPKSCEIAKDGSMLLGEVAQFLKVSERTVSREVKAGKLKAFRVGHSLRFKREVVEEHMNAQEVQPGEHVSEDVDDAA